MEPKEIDPQELLRAQFVIAKATRDNLNLVEVLTSHMVSKTLRAGLALDQLDFPSSSPTKVAPGVAPGGMRGRGGGLNLFK